MIVKNFEIMSNNASEIGTLKELFINGIRFSSNIPYIEILDNNIQIEACSHCNSMGCNDKGFVEVLLEDKIIIWKEPTNNTSDKQSSLFDGVKAFNNGSLIWDIESYKTFLLSFGENIENQDIHPATVDQAYDLWRIYGSTKIFSNYLDRCSIEYLDESMFGKYSEDYDELECRYFWKQVRTESHKVTNVTFTKINEDMKIIKLMYGNVDYREWDGLYLLDKSSMVLPIGDGFGYKLQW